MGVLASPVSMSSSAATTTALPQASTSSTTTITKVTTKPPLSCRVVSEHRKLNRNGSFTNINTPTMCGWLDIRWIDRWNSRQVELCPGELRVFRPATINADNNNDIIEKQLEFKLPLRHLSLLPAEDYDNLAFSLEPPNKICRRRMASSYQQILIHPIVFRAHSEQEYEKWVRSLAVELMRQTPLEALRFLDVLGITQHKTKQTSSTTTEEDTTDSSINSHNVLSSTVSAPSSLIKSSRNNGIDYDETNSLRNYGGNNEQLTRLVNVDPLHSRLQGRSIGIRSIPVKERRAIFENLIAANSSRSSISTENLSTVSSFSSYRNTSNDHHHHFSRKCSYGLKARSLLDLRRSAPPTSTFLPDFPRRSLSIRELCKIFENGPPNEPPPPPPCPPSPPPPLRPESPDEVCMNPYLSKRRLQRAQRRLTALRERATTVEDTIWRLQEQMAEMDRDQSRSCRTSRAERFAVLERKHEEEERQYAAIQDEINRVVRCVEDAARKLDCALGVTASVSCSSWDQASTCSSSGVSSDSG